MSETQKSGGAAADTSGAQGGETKTKTVSVEELDRALKDLHKYKALAKDLETKFQSIEQEKLMAEGKKDELISSLQKQINDEKAKRLDLHKRQAREKVSGWLKTKAMGDGIVNDGGAVDKFVALVNFKERNPFKDESEFLLDDGVLSEVYEQHKKEMPYFFAKGSPNLRDANPTNNDVGSSGAGNDYSKMSLDQIREQARKLSAVR